jgi:hypothetical protein
VPLTGNAGGLGTGTPVVSTGTATPFGTNTPVVPTGGTVTVVAAVAIGSDQPGISPEGDWVVFESRGLTLLGQVPSGGTRIFIANLRTGLIEEVSGDQTTAPRSSTK